MAVTSHDAGLCLLEQALGADGVCPEELCPFWEPGGAVLEGRCVYEGVDFGRDLDLAVRLLGIRERAEASPSPVDA